MAIKRLSVIAALVALLGGAVFAALPAKAGCVTHCTRDPNGGQTCNTQCS